MNGDDLYINFERSGGFAGMVNSVEISGDTLSEEDYDQLVTLIDQSGFFEFDTTGKSNQGYPDQFNYIIEIKRSGESKKLEIGESAVDDQLRPLIDHLSGISRRKR